MQDKCPQGSSLLPRIGSGAGTGGGAGRRPGGAGAAGAARRVRRAGGGRASAGSRSALLTGSGPRSGSVPDRRRAWGSTALACAVGLAVTMIASIRIRTACGFCSYLEPCHGPNSMRQQSSSSEAIQTVTAQAWQRSVRKDGDCAQVKLIQEPPAPAPGQRLRGVVERELRGGRRREVSCEIVGPGSVQSLRWRSACNL